MNKKFGVTNGRAVGKFNSKTNELEESYETVTIAYRKNNVSEIKFRKHLRGEIPSLVDGYYFRYLNESNEG